MSWKKKRDKAIVDEFANFPVHYMYVDYSEDAVMSGYAQPVDENEDERKPGKLKVLTHNNGKINYLNEPKGQRDEQIKAKSIGSWLVGVFRRN